MIYSTYPPNYQVDGIGDYTRILVAKLRERGMDVHVITSGRYAGNDPKVIKIGGGVWGIRELVKVFRKIREERFNVVHMQYTPLSYGFGVVFKLLPLLVRLSAHGIRFVTTFHTLVGGRWISKINALLITMFSHSVISTHEEMTQLFNKWFFMFRKKLVQIPIGSNIFPCDTDKGSVRPEINKRFGISERAVLLINFGFPNPWKGLETLFYSLKILSRQDRYRLILLGDIRDEDMEYRHRLKGLVRRLGINREVIWIEGLDEKTASEVILASDICVLPYVDGISIRRGSLMAAMAHGLPVISTFPRVKNPYFRNGENVVFVKEGDRVALAEAMERLADDPAARERLSRNIREIAKTFDWSVIADKTAEIYRGRRPKGAEVVGR